MLVALKSAGYLVEAGPSDSKITKAYCSQAWGAGEGECGRLTSSPLCPAEGLELSAQEVSGISMGSQKLGISGSQDAKLMAGDATGSPPVLSSWAAEAYRRK